MSNLKKFEVAIRAYETRDDEFIKKNFELFSFSENTVKGEVEGTTRVREFIEADNPRDALFYSYKVGNEYILFPNYDNPSYSAYDIGYDGDIYKIKSFNSSKEYSNEVIKPIIVKFEKGFYRPIEDVSFFEYISKPLIDLKRKWQNKPASTSTPQKPKKLPTVKPPEATKSPETPKQPEEPKVTQPTTEVNWADLIPEDSDNAENLQEAIKNEIETESEKNNTPISNISSAFNPNNDNSTVNKAVEELKKASEAIGDFSSAFDSGVDNVEQLNTTQEEIANTVLGTFQEETEEVKRANVEQAIKLQKEKAKAEENKLEGKEDTEEPKKEVKDELEKKAKGSGLFKGILKTFEPFISFIVDLITFKALQWLADKNNQGKIKAFFDFVKPIAQFINGLANFAINNIFGGLSDIAKAFDNSDGFQAKDIIEKPALFVSGVVKLYLGISAIGLLLGKGWGFSILKKTFNFIVNIPNYFRKLKWFLGQLKKITIGLKNAVVGAAKYIGRGVKRAILNSKTGRTFLNTISNSRVLRGAKDLVTKSKGVFGRLTGPVGRFLKNLLPRLSGQGVKNFLGKGAAIITKIPGIGPLVDFLINKYVFGMPTDEAGIRAIGGLFGSFIGGVIGGAVGGVVGSVVPVIGNLVAGGAGAKIGVVLGGIAGDQLAKILYDMTKGTAKMAEGGIVDEPTLAIIGEAGREYVIPEDKLGGTGDLEFAKIMIGSTDAFFGGFGSKSNLFINDVNGMLMPLKREAGSEQFTFGTFISPKTDGKKYNILGLEEPEMENFRKNLEIIDNQLKSSNVKEGTESTNAVTSSMTASETKSASGKMVKSVETANNISRGFMGGTLSGIQGAAEDVMDNISSVFGTPIGNEQFINPLPGSVFTSGYGRRRGKMHRGIDLSTPFADRPANGVGGPVFASASGKVTTAGWSGADSYGNLVVIDHGNGYVTRYGHLSSINTKVDEYVTQGQQIGIEGTTGFSTGVHLHFEILKDGSHVDPKFVIDKKGSYTKDTSPQAFNNEESTGETESTFSFQDVAVAFETLAIRLGLLNKRITKKEDFKPPETSLSDTGSINNNIYINNKQNNINTAANIIDQSKPSNKNPVPYHGPVSTVNGGEITSYLFWSDLNKPQPTFTGRFK